MSRDSTAPHGSIEPSRHPARGASQDALVALVYDELRTLARRLVAHEAVRQTPGATALVHEAYLRLLRSPGGCWASKRDFYLAAAAAMRRILIERARRRRRVRHGGAWRRTGTGADDVGHTDGVEMRIALERAIAALEREEPRKAQVVRLRYYLDLRIDEVADVLGISPATVKLDWNYAKAWLHRRIAQGAPRAQ
jgi:RNA polymerase sigma factor (TIGR02999 family)